MLGFLVTSRARRRLLMLLWERGAQGSVGELADRAGVAFASAHRELKAMRRCGLAESVSGPGKEIYRADESHPDAELVRSLVRSGVRRSGGHDPATERTRRRLKALGAPLDVDADPQGRVDVEVTLAEGTRLARRDPTIARVLPICFHAVRDRLDPVRLRKQVRRAEDKHAIGFFLALTAELAGDPWFEGVSAMFRDRRMGAERDFFDVPGTRRARRLAEERTPAMARRWGFRMNMGLDSFEQAFDKLAEHHA